MSAYRYSGGLYRAKVSKKVSGVCAGVAGHYGFPVWAVRLAAVLLFLALPMAVLIAYLAATVILPSRYL